MGLFCPEILITQIEMRIKDNDPDIIVYLGKSPCAAVGQRMLAAEHDRNFGVPDSPPDRVPCHAQHVIDTAIKVEITEIEIAEIVHGNRSKIDAVKIVVRLKVVARLPHGIGRLGTSASKRGGGIEGHAEYHEASVFISRDCIRKDAAFEHQRISIRILPSAVMYWISFPSTTRSL